MNGTKVIIVDDDPDTVEVFSEYLGLKGIKVLGTAYNGKEAVEQYQELKPDIVFMDLKMPEYDGIYGIKHIRKKDSQAKIIVVTGNPARESDPELKTLKPNAILFKPFNIEEILDEVNKLMNVTPKQKI